MTDELVPIPIDQYMDWTKKEGMLAISMEMMIQQTNHHFEQMPWWKRLIIRKYLSDVNAALDSVHHIWIRCGRELLVTTELLKNGVVEIRVQPDHKSLTGESYALDVYTYLFGELTNDETT